MNRISRTIYLTAIVLTLFLNTTVNAQDGELTDVCRDSGVAFMFFNGVQTTPAQANIALHELKRIHGSTSSAGEALKYEVMYNYSSGFEDFVETFEQRLLEQEGLLEGRFELFFQALNDDGDWWTSIKETSSAAAGVLGGFVDWYQAAAVQNLTALFSDPPTALNYLEHRSRIENRILEGKKVLFVAHSQGNLFANAAYDYAISISDASSVKIVHIAPASPDLNGPHTLADKDLVINGLRVAGSVPAITQTIPGYLLRPAGANGETDFLGHGLIEIYINQRLAIATEVKNNIDTAIGALEAPPVQAVSGFFTATLTWDGAGDVDLHTFEPDGSHVYYRSKSGNSGYLDVDNTVANGPEHYYASCNSASLQTGTYQIALANYARATGRTATVQIASWNDGVLGTESAVMGEETRSTPTYYLFDVVVSRNADTGAYEVSLGR